MYVLYSTIVCIHHNNSETSSDDKLLAVLTNIAHMTYACIWYFPMSYVLRFIHTEAYPMTLILFHLLICEASVVHCHHQHSILFAIKHGCLIGYHLHNYGWNNHVLFNKIHCAYVPKALSHHSRDTQAGLMDPRL